MEKSLIETEQSFVSHDEATEVSDPSEGAFDFPTFSVSSQRTSILQRKLSTILAMRADQSNAAIEQSPAQWIAVVSSIGNDAKRSAFGSPPTGARHSNLGQGRFGQGYFRGRCRGKLASQRNTLAVCHHHPLRSFAFLCFSHAEPPFLAGAKLPSMNASLQSRVWRWSN